MDHLVMKARFEEAKRRELAAVRITTPLPRRVSQSSPTAPANSGGKSPFQVRKTNPPDAADERAKAAH